MLSLPNQEIFNYQQRNIIAVKNTNEKYIKIKSSVPQFYWTLEFSLENDVKYLLIILLVQVNLKIVILYIF